MDLEEISEIASGILNKYEALTREEVAALEDIILVYKILDDTLDNYFGRRSVTSDGMFIFIDPTWSEERKDYSFAMQLAALKYLPEP